MEKRNLIQGIPELNSQVEKFENFLDLFLSKNSVLNLSAIRDEDGVIKKHFVDSLILNNFLKLEGKVLDIGTGGGFPGIPLAITNSNVEFVLLDSTRKKIDAVNSFIESLNLSNCIGIWGRAEEIAKNENMKGQFDYIVSRATAYLPQITLWSKSFLKPNGKMIFYKLYNENEIKDGELIIKRLGLTIQKIEKYELDNQERCLIIIGK